jgi:hypothetical protein
MCLINCFLERIKNLGFKDRNELNIYLILSSLRFLKGGAFCPALKTNFSVTLGILFFFYSSIYCLDSPSLREESIYELYLELEKIEEINKKINDALPLHFNYLAQAGYFLMPSARSASEGNIVFSYSYLPPYRNYNVSFQFFNHLELSANYRLFHGLIDSNLGPLGYGDVTDREVNFKVNLLKAHDGADCLPEIAVGLNDFMGSKTFRSWFVVTTKSFLDYNCELTFGWGCGRMKGFYGAFSWTPWRQKGFFLKNLSLTAEYDCNDYSHAHNEHPLGREVKFPMNVGLHYQLFDLFQFSLSSLRGCDVAASVSMSYNLGKTKGIFPKIKDPPMCSGPVDHEPLGERREEKEFACQLALELKKQGFALNWISLFYENKKKVIWMKVVNLQYRRERIVRERIQNVVGALLPADIERVKVVIETEGLLSHEYIYQADYLKRYFSNQMGEEELEIISPMKEVSEKPGPYDSLLLYKRNNPVWTLTLIPKFRNYFGSAKGKFKYDLGLQGGCEGYLFDQIYYNIQASYIFFSSAGNISAKDTLNPSRIINVRSDIIRYYQENSFHLEKGYLQRNWNLSNGLFLRLSGGYFEIAYGGASAELLYYPIGSPWAVGVELSSLFKREYSGLNFTNKVYKFNGKEAVKVDYIGSQYFIDLYYTFQPLDLDFKVSLGQFLAKDKGIKLQVGHTFVSGLTVYLWYTFTNKVDIVNGARYYDKGIGFSFPLDFFLTKSSKTRVGYAMSAWLRDVGARVCTGKELYPILYYERE